MYVSAITHSRLDLRNPREEVSDVVRSGKRKGTGKRGRGTVTTSVQPRIVPNWKVNSRSKNGEGLELLRGGAGTF